MNSTTIPTSNAEPRWCSGVAALLFLVVTINYAWQAVSLATHNSLWMDEVLAVWAARLPDIRAVWMALIHGSEFSPPLYDLLLHALVKLGLHSTLAMRAPSILAFYLAAVAIGLLVRRRGGWMPAAIAAAFVLTSGVFTYAVQARPYGCLLCVIAWALYVWDGLPDGRRSGWRVIALGLLLAIAVGLHFYAIVLVGGFGLAELGLTVVTRRIRPMVLAAIALAGASILLWLPIIHAAAAFLGTDALAPLYYGKPSITLLLSSYATIFGYGHFLVFELLCFVLYRVLRGQTWFWAPQPDPKRILAALLLAGVPVAISLLAAIVTHSYAERYTIAAVLGFALLFSWLVQSPGREAPAAALVFLATLALASFQLNGGAVDGPTRTASLAVIRAAPPGLPIATGNGGRYFELMEALPATATRRLVFIGIRAGSTDPTNQHEVERWAGILPILQARDAEAFVRETPCFLWFVDPSVLHDDLPDWMPRRITSVRWLNPGPARLGLVEARPGGCAKSPAG